MGLKWLKIVKNAQMGVIGLAEVKHSHLTLAGENDQLYHPGIHAYAMGEGGIRMEPQRGGRERCINTVDDSGAHFLYVQCRI